MAMSEEAKWQDLSIELALNAKKNLDSKDDEITTLRQQLAKSEARVAELIHSRQIDKTSMLMRVSRLSETLEAIRSGEFSLPKCQQLADRALGSPVTEAAILRLQAEAVEKSALLFPGRELTDIRCSLHTEAQRLRQQADEAERPQSPQEGSGYE